MKSIATKEVVFEAAQAIAATGAEPTIKNVQERTGGSYTTVKQHLDAWAIERAQRDDVAVPEQIALKGQEFIKTLFSIAFQQVREAAAVEVAAAQEHAARLQQALQGTESEIARLEDVERHQVVMTEQLQQRLHDAELASAAAAGAAKEQAALFHQMQGELVTVREQLSARDQEVAALKAQLIEMQKAGDLRAEVARLSEQITAQSRDKSS